MSKKNETSIFQPVEKLQAVFKVSAIYISISSASSVDSFSCAWFDLSPSSSLLFSNFLFFCLTAWKVSRYEIFSGPYFPVFRTNTGKYGPEKTPYLDTFHAVRSFLKSIRQLPVWPWKYTLAARASQSPLLYTSPNNSSFEHKQIQHNLSFT